MNDEPGGIPNGELIAPAGHEALPEPSTQPNHPPLRVLTSMSTPPHADDVLARAGWQSDASEIWQAWRGLEDWEDLVETRFDRSFGRHLLVLWALYAFRGGSEEILRELVAENLEPQFGDPVIEDMVRVAFALGASWAAAGGASPARTTAGLHHGAPQFRVHPSRPA